MSNSSKYPRPRLVAKTFSHPILSNSAAFFCMYLLSLSGTWVWRGWYTLCRALGGHHYKSLYCLLLIWIGIHRMQCGQGLRWCGNGRHRWWIYIPPLIPSDGFCRYMRVFCRRSLALVPTPFQVKWRRGCGRRIPSQEEIILLRCVGEVILIPHAEDVAHAFDVLGWAAVYA